MGVTGGNNNGGRGIFEEKWGMMQGNDKPLDLGS